MNRRAQLRGGVLRSLAVGLARGGFAGCGGCGDGADEGRPLVGEQMGDDGAKVSPRHAVAQVIEAAAHAQQIDAYRPLDPGRGQEPEEA